MIRYNNSINGMEMANPFLAYELAPSGEVFEHQDIGKVQGYYLEDGYDVWKSIVTRIRRGMEPGSPYLFTVVSALANSHTQIAEAIGWPIAEPKHVLPEISLNPFYLRLEADEVFNRRNENVELVAQVAHTAGVPNLNALNLGASLINAARTLPPAFGTKYDSFKINTTSISGAKEGYWGFSPVTNHAIRS